MEDALFFPSGTMANQTAIKLHTQPGDKLICDKYAHVYNYEGGGAAFNSGVTCKLIDGQRGMFTAAQLEETVVGRADIHVPYSRLVCIENTTNKGGGACWDFSELEKIQKIAKENNLAFHLDGARLFNALVAKKESPEQYGQLFDTISICLSKGLGAPIGSILLGSKKDIAKALRIRKLFGGAMRQVGFLAAAGIYALDNHINRLQKDHQKAKEIGAVLESVSYVIKLETIETNIVIFYVDEKIGATKFIQKMKDKNILLTPMGEGRIRIVTHLDYTKKMHEILLKALKEF
jgi:threonine aldolase